MTAGKNPLASVSNTMTSQRQPMPGVANQVRNAAGGYVFEKDLWTKVEDFLILGTTGGTFYTSEAKLTTANVDVLRKALAADPQRFVALVKSISASIPSRAVKPDPCLFALALADADPKARPYVKGAFSSVARTTDHLAKSFGYGKNLWGKTSKSGHGTSPVMNRSRRTMLASWFNEADVHDVAFRALKARQRKTPQGEAMELRDIIRIAHVGGRTPEHRALIGWLAGRITDGSAREILPDVDNFLVAQAVKTPKEAVKVITERRVPWEFLPSEVLESPQVWEALIDTIGLTALVRNLARMTRIGTLQAFSENNQRVVSRLTNPDKLVRARIHPMELYLALKVYESGSSQPNAKAQLRQWQPVASISNALAEAYALSFGGVEPSGARMLLAVDSSGSMSGSYYGGQVIISGSPLKSPPYELANAMALTTARIEGDLTTHVIDVDTSVHASRITSKSRIGEIRGWMPSGGGTNLSLPFSYARQKSLKVDGFVVYTDNETWAGRSHPAQELAAYRREVNPEARVVIVSMTATGYQIADPADEAVMAMAGLDASLPKVISGWIRKPGRDHSGGARHELAEDDE